MIRPPRGSGTPRATTLRVVEPVTRVTMFVPGTPTSLAAWGALSGPMVLLGEQLRIEGIDAPVEVEWIANDGEFARAFSFGTVGPDTLAQLDAAPGALVLHWPVDLRTGRESMLEAVAALQRAGALAVRLEQSKLGWTVERWLELFSDEHPWPWHQGAVALMAGDGTLQSCGMHAFSLPDVRLDLDDDPAAARELASVFNVYRLAEDPTFRSGHTFAPDADTPRRVVERWPDTEYLSGHPCHNPYGVWHLRRAASAAHPLGETVSVFVPALVAVLTALEQQHGAPLTQAQVEATRDAASCIAMAPRDADALERSRGYADLEPELVWEQWQLVRDADR